MIAVDTSILVYAHRADAEHHQAALDAVRSLVEANRPWALPWPCLHEFLAIASHSRIYRPPTPLSQAFQALSDLIDMAGATLIRETTTHAATLARLCIEVGVTGPRIHDARVAAICLDHGVDELWSADRDFSYFPELQTRNPLVPRSRR